MFCPNCGTQLPDGSKFCAKCGTALNGQTGAETAEAAHAAEPRLVQDPSLPEGIFRDENGAYHWVYHLNMLRNPAPILTVFKVFFLVISGISVFFFVISLLGGTGLKDSLRFYIIMFFGMNALFFVLGSIAWGIMTLRRGARYTIEHMMNEELVAYLQTPEEQERSRQIGALAVAAGAISGNLSTMGIGLTQGSMNGAFVSRYPDVKAVIASRRFHLIKVNNVLQHNQIYAYPHQYDFVWSFITSHCPNAKIKE